MQRILVGDCIEVMRTLPSGSAHCCVTSPPYFGLRNYGVDGQIGLEPTPDHYVASLVDVFREVRRVLRDDGTLWLNLGDSYGKKSLLGIPWRVAFALQADGWYLRSDIIWHKPNPMPESCRDRPTRAHEYLFLLAKSDRYFFDMEAVKEEAVTAGTSKQFGRKDAKARGVDRLTGNMRPGVRVTVAETRNPRTVWTITPKPFKGTHFAVFPPALVEPCVKAGTSERGCCPQCKMPIRRIVERKRVATRPGADTKVAGTSADAIGNRDPLRHISLTETTGWKVCEHLRGEGWCGEPCTVIDPFAGSGTTGVVCKQLGRSFIGIELNPEYADMARGRIAS